ncbi:MAG: TldD/PmbA family protein [Candidatus Jordarchaeaceae archaeon]
MDLFRVLGELSQAKYSDVRFIRQKLVDVALREGTADVFERNEERIVCRAISRGYGVASTNVLDSRNIENVSRLALKQAEVSEMNCELLPVKVERGEKTYLGKKGFEVEDVLEFLKNIRDEAKDSMGNFYSRSEFVASFSFTDSIFISSEGANIVEKTSLVDVFVYLVARGISEGIASKSVGGRGGFEIIEEEDWNSILEDLTMRAIESTEAGVMISGREKKFNVILDNYSAGGLVHEIAHMLEADIHRSTLFHNLEFEEPLKIIDDPLMERGYGSFYWDDEGVSGSSKTLLSEEGVKLLHTRLTAKGEEKAGNAHGIFHIPRPLMSNVYFKPSDWKVDEILEETRFGIYCKGIIRAESIPYEGKFELSPEIGYIVKGGKTKQPIKHFKINGDIRKVLHNIDAIGRDFHMRPNIEKGFPISEGGPHIRISGIHCI